MTRLDFKKDNEGVYSMPKTAGQKIRSAGTTALKTAAAGAFGAGLFGFIGVTALTPEDQAPEVVSNVSEAVGSAVRGVFAGSAGAKIAQTAVGSAVTQEQQDALTKIIKSSQTEKRRDRIEPIGADNDDPDVRVDPGAGVTTILKDRSVVVPAPKPQGL